MTVHTSTTETIKIKFTHTPALKLKYGHAIYKGASSSNGHTPCRHGHPPPARWTWRRVAHVCLFSSNGHVIALTTPRGKVVHARGQTLVAHDLGLDAKETARGADGVVDAGTSRRGDAVASADCATD